MSALKNYLDVETLLSYLIMGMRGSSLIIKFLFTLFMAKFLGFEYLGLYGLIFSSAILMRVILGLSFSYTLSRKAVTQSLEKTCSEFKHYLSYTFILYSLLLLLGLIISGFVNHFVLTVLIIFVIYTEHLANDFYILLLNLSRPFVANSLHFLRTGLWMSIYMVTAYIFPTLRNVESIMLFWLVGNFVSIVIFFFIVRKWPWFKVKSRKSLKFWITNEFKQSKTIYSTDCLNTISSYWNHFLITIFLGLEFTGVFVYFMQLNSALSNLMQTGVIQIYKPKMVKACRNKGEFFALYKEGINRTVVTSVILACSCGPFFYYITILLKKSLAIEWIFILIPLLFSFILNMISEMNKLVFYSLHRDDIILKNVIIAMPVMMIIKCTFVPLFLLWGAVATSIISSIFALTLHYHFLKKLQINKL